MDKNEIAIRKLFGRWLKRSLQVLRMEIRKKKIGETDALYRDLTTDMRPKGQQVLEGLLTMLTRGRFVDMGVGRGVPMGGRRASADEMGSPRRKRRRPKKWYSRTWYGRLHALHGAIGYTMMEQSISAIKQPLKDKK